MDNTSKYMEFVHQLERFCDYQDRCIADVEAKMNKIDIPLDMQKDILDYLIDEKYLDENRFAISFSIGKLRHNKWGKIKIYNGLKQRNVNTSIINTALRSINEDEYLTILRQIIKHKISQIGSITVDKNKKRLLNFALQRGFESDLIWKIIRETELNTINDNKR